MPKSSAKLPHIIGFPDLNIACKQVYNEFQKLRALPGMKDSMILLDKDKLHKIVDLC